MTVPTAALDSICCRISSGGTPSRKNAGYFTVEPGGHLWVKSKELLDCSISDTEERISEEGLNNSSAKYYPAHSVLIAMYGANVGQLGWLRRPATVNQAICGLVVDDTKADWRFVFYSLLHTRGDLTIQAQGAAQQNLNQDLIRQFEIPLPPLPIQRRIAGILSAYDELIENSQRRIKILEAMARALYREWFVHFRFPGHKNHPRVASPLGEIPRGWEVRTVEEIVKRIPVGKKYDQKTVTPTGRVPVFDQGKSGIIGYHDDEPGVVASENAPVIVFANHTCYQRLVHIPFSAIQNVLPFVANPSLPRNVYWLNWATNGLVVFNDYKGHWPEFVAKTLIVPPAELCQRFGKFAAPMSLQGLKLERQIDNLRRTRDLLLPRLLSGQIGVEAA